MKKRPLLFIILGILHILEPIFKLINLKIVTEYPWDRILSNVFSIHDPKALFEFWLLFPLAGVSLLMVNRYSYLIFVGIQFYSIFLHLTYKAYEWPYVSKTPFFSSIIILVFNCLIILYFLMDHVREPFFNKHLRWWETKKRYACKIAALVKNANLQEAVALEILNVSETGIFLSNPGTLAVNDEIKVEFTFQQEKFQLDGLVVSIHNSMNVQGLGVHLHFQNIYERLDFKKLVRMVRKLNNNVSIYRSRSNRGKIS